MASRRMDAAAGIGNPVEKMLHARAVTPEKREEFSGIEIRGFLAEEGFQAPLNVGRSPGRETMALGDDPVVAQSVQHGAGSRGDRILGEEIGGR
jgi:hypothetical protein